MSVCLYVTKIHIVKFLKIGAYDLFLLCIAIEDIDSYQMTKITSKQVHFLRSYGPEMALHFVTSHSISTLKEILYHPKGIRYLKGSCRMTISKHLILQDVVFR